MSLAIALYATNCAGFAALLRWGAAVDRLAVMAIAIFFVATPLIGPLEFGTWRVGYALVDTALCLALCWLADRRRRRWWLVLAAGALFLTAITHVIPVFAPDEFSMPGFFTRQGMWMLISAPLFAGAWESWADSKFRSPFA